MTAGESVRVRIVGRQADGASPGDVETKDDSVLIVAGVPTRAHGPNKKARRLLPGAVKTMAGGAPARLGAGPRSSAGGGR